MLRASNFPKSLRPNQLCYDLRKLKGHGLLEHDGFRYAYRQTKGIQVALLFLFFHKRLCGPHAKQPLSITFRTLPEPRANSKLPYHKADMAIQDIVELLAAA
jgi:hypothetical protein